MIALLTIWCAATVCQEDELDPQIERQVVAIVRQLNGIDAAERTEAEQSLDKLGPGANLYLDRVVLDVSPEARQAIERVQKKWAQQRSEAMLKPTKVTLKGTMTLEQAFRSLGDQAGIQIVGAEGLGGDVTIDMNDVDFWRALDQLFAGTSLRLYPYGGEAGELRIVAPEEVGEQPETSHVCYDGPFRVEAVRCESTKDYRQPSADQLRVVLGIHWEPRVRPIAFQQDMNEIKAWGEPSDEEILGQNVDVQIEAAVQPEIPFAEMTLPFELPTAASMSQMRGTLHAIIPSVPEKFTFENLDEKSAGTEIRKGGLVVRLEGWTSEDSIHAVRLRLHFDSENGALESFRSWIMNNEIELNDGMGTTYKPLGTEVSKQSAEEVVIRYLFQKDPATMNLEYWSSTDIFKVPIKIDLQNIILP